MNSEKFYYLSAKILSGEATLLEQAEFSNLIADNKKWKEDFEKLEELWQSKKLTEASNILIEEAYFKHISKKRDEIPDLIDYETDNDFHYQNELIDAPSKKMFYASPLFYTVVVLVGLFFWGSYQFFLKPSATNESKVPDTEIAVKPGTKTKIQLPDGSVVWINSDSKITYPHSFSKNTREVYLEGEAYFDIKKDSAHPFLVHTKGMDIRVLGTIFNVRAHIKEPTIEATLIHGSIEVINTFQPHSPKVLLKPNEKLIFNKESQTKENGVVPNSLKKTKATNKNNSETNDAAFTITKIPQKIEKEQIKEIAWVYNRLEFEEKRFEEVAIDMERWFNVKIDIKNEKIKNVKLTGSFQNETVEEALKALQYIIPFSYKIDGTKINISN